MTPVAAPTDGTTAAPGRRGVVVRRDNVATVLALAVAAMVCLAAPAGAHSVLLSSDPAQGESVAAPPTRVALVFSDDVVTLGTRIEVTVDGGEPVGGEPVVDGTRVVVPLDDAPPPGKYVVLWRVTSSDGHPISGELDFAVTGAADGAAAVSPAPTGVDPGDASPGPAGATDPGRASPGPVAEVGDSDPAAAGSGRQPAWLFVGVALVALVAAGVGAAVLWRGRPRGP